MRVCVLIPSYNEGRTISGIIRAAMGKVDSVIVVDDGSTDGTGDEARRTGAVVITHPENRGKGVALKTGFEYALEKGYDGVLVMDGDGQHDPADIDVFLEVAERTDTAIILGNRMGNTRDMPIVRYLTNRFTSMVISRITHQGIPDSQCGFRLIRSDVLRELELETAKFETESEMLIAASRKGYKIESVRVSTIYGKEKSKINPIVDTIRFLRLVLASRGKVRDRG